MLKSKIQSLPKQPGVYLFKDNFDNIIYIGKAKSLRNRVSSYFSQDHKLSPKTRILVKNIVDLDFIIVDNEIESLLLENKLIKKNKPKYNINLKDSKTYSYIKITDEKIPKIVSTRIVNDKGDYFGPYSDGFLRREIVNLVVSIFKLVTKSTYSSKSSLNYDIGLAPAKSLADIDEKWYLEQVQEAKSFLKGNVTKTLNRLKFEMKKASNDKKYEVALERKRQIDAIEHLKEKQNVDLIKGYDQDVIAFVVNDKTNQAIIVLFNVSRGVISGKKEHKFEYDEELFESFVKMYYSQNSIPKEIIVNYDFEDKDLLEKYLSKNRGSKVNITKPIIGDKLQLVKLAEKNAMINFEENVILKEIKDKLNLPKIPHIIECFDMSNLSYDHLVGGMTRFIDGKPDKDNYRKFEIKSFSKRNDDYASMSEVVYRRYKKLKDENRIMPDLIIIDGGKGQLGAALDSLRNLRLQIPIISLAKKEEEIFTIHSQTSLKFDKNSNMMLFIRNIRDSTHNYVIAYNKKKRDMKLREEFEK